MFWGGYEPPVSVKADGAIARRLYQIEAARNAYFAELDDLLDTVWKEDQLIEQIESLEELIEPHRVSSTGNQGGQGKDLKQFVANRREAIVEELKEGHPEWTLAVREAPPGFGKYGEAKVDLVFQMPEIPDGMNEFVPVKGTAKVTMASKGEESTFETTMLAMKQNRGWGGGSLAVQITRMDAEDGAPSTIEVTFPKNYRQPKHPVRLDVFASPGSGRLLMRSGNVGQEGTAGMMAGELKLDNYQAGVGDTVTGQLVAEIYGPDR
jgi:hypothetical protein